MQLYSLTNLLVPECSVNSFRGNVTGFLVNAHQEHQELVGTVSGIQVSSAKGMANHTVELVRIFLQAGIILQRIAGGIR